MPKILAISGMVVAALILLLFGLDAALPIFHRPSLTMDIIFLICAGLLGYMSWSTYREVV